MTTLRARLRPQGLRVTPPRVLAGALLLVLVTVIALWRSDVPNVFRAVALIAHIGLGLLVVPLALFTLYEIYKKRRRAFPIGHALVLATGTAVLVVGGERRFAMVLAAHAAIGAAFFAWSVFPRRVAFLGAPIAFVVVGIGVNERAREFPATTEPLATVGEGVATGALTLVTAALVDDAPERFLDEARCKNCHRRVVETHHEGGHSARKNSRFLVERRAHAGKHGQADVQRCDTCHDVAARVRVTSTSATSDTRAPLPCLTCHGGSTTHFSSSGTELRLALPDDPVVTTDGIWRSFARALTHIDARAHRARMRTTTTRSTMGCTICHHASAHAPPPHSEAKPSEGASVARDDTRAHWPFERAGPSSPLRGGSHHVCVDCHAHDFGPMAPRLAIALFRTDVTPDATPLVDGNVFLSFAHDRIALDLLITNENAGHGFPASPFDREFSVVVDIESEDESPIANAAALSLHPRPLGARVVEGRTLVFDEPLAPGRGHTIHLDLPLPVGTPPVRVSVRLLSSSDVQAADAIASTRTTRSVAPALLLARYADALARVDHRLDAERALTWAETLAPDDLDVKLARARFLLERSEAPSAAFTLLANEHDDHARFLRARAAMAEKRVDEARAMLEALSTTAPFDVELALTWANALDATSGHEHAQRVRRTGLAGNPGHRHLLDALHENADRRPSPAGDAQ